MTAQTTTAQGAGPVAAERGRDARRGLRTCGAIGIGAGLLFGAMTVWEHAVGPAVPGGMPGPIIRSGFVLAMLGFVVLSVGLALARPGGDGRTARLFPALLAGAWTALVAGALLEWFASVDPETNPLNPIGGLAQGIALVGFGVTVAVARRWTGWRRFAPLGFAAYYVGALFVPAVAGVEPSTIVEATWALGYAVLGFALMTAGGARHRLVAVATGVLSAGVLTAAVVVTTTAATVPPQPASVPIVQDGRSGGPDVYEPRPPAIFEDGRQGASIFDSTDTVYPGRRPA